MTLIAPRGVTRMAGAKVYAAKLATAVSGGPEFGWDDCQERTFTNNH